MEPDGNVRTEPRELVVACVSVWKGQKTLRKGQRTSLALPTQFSCLHMCFLPQPLPVLTADTELHLYCQQLASFLSISFRKGYRDHLCIDQAIGGESLAKVSRALGRLYECVGMRGGEALRSGESDNLFSYLHTNLTDQSLVPPGTKLRGLGGGKAAVPWVTKSLCLAAAGMNVGRRGRCICLWLQRGWAGSG